MESLAINDDTCTTIGTHESGINMQLCNACRNYEDDMYYVQDCRCPPDPNHQYIAILVKVRGKPVTRKPDECTYDVIIWDNVMVKSQCNVSSLWDIDPTFHLTFEATVDPSDMEYKYSEILNKYNQQLTKLKKADCAFKGVSSSSSYLSDFTARINTLTTSKCRIDKSECAHIASRKKGHSHVRDAS